MLKVSFDYIWDGTGNAVDRSNNPLQRHEWGLNSKQMGPYLERFSKDMGPRRK